MPTMHKNKKMTGKFAFNAAIFVAVFFFGFQYASAEDMTADGVLNLVNKARSEHGLSVLVRSAALDQVALEKANDMLANNYFAHTSPAGVDPWHWFDQVGYDFKFAGENLAINYADAEEQHSAWMKSETHRKNILNMKYQETGISVSRGVIDGKETILTVEVFGTSMSAAAESNEILPAAGQKFLENPEQPKEAATVASADAELREPIEIDPSALTAQKKQIGSLDYENISEGAFAERQVIAIGTIVLALGLMLTLLASKLHGLALEALDGRRELVMRNPWVNAEYQAVLKDMNAVWHKTRRNHSIEIRGG